MKTITTDNIGTKVKELTLIRVRRSLMRLREDPEALAKGVIDAAHIRFWRDYGYPRLLEFLRHELGLQLEPAAEIVAQAIKNGHEEPGLYYEVETTEQNNK